MRIRLAVGTSQAHKGGGGVCTDLKVRIDSLQKNQHEQSAKNDGDMGWGVVKTLGNSLIEIERSRLIK